MTLHAAAPEDDDSASPRPRLGTVLAAVILALLIVAAAFVAWQLRNLHFPTAAEVTAPRGIVVLAADGHPLVGRGTFRLPPAAVQDMPADVVNAVISIEDRRFYQHGGIDVQSMLRALLTNLKAGQIVAGGSTITQQLVKILFLGPQRTYRRKIQEAALAIWLELHLRKDQILTSYLNDVYLGSGVTGFPAAAKLYFDKKVSDLSLPEAAMLAGMINAPSQDDPLHDLDAARNRAGAVLDAMVENGKLSPERALVAKLHPAAPVAPDLAPASAGWFADWIYRKAAGAASTLGGAVSIRTTLDLRLQNLAADVIKSTLAAEGASKHVSEAALVAMRPDGAVVAMVGGRSYDDSQFNRAVQAKRQPGSAFKLFDYYAALRQGFSPDDEILDAPVDVNGWQPDNYALRYHGRVTLAQAFADSLNAATVRLSQQVGIPQVIAAARDLGLQAPLDNVPSLALGTADVSLLDLTSAYASVRAGMAPVRPWGIASLRMPGRKDYLPVGRPDIPQHSLGAYQDELTGLLQGVVAHGTGRAAALPGLAAGKTGTSQDYRDAWFVGFDTALVVGVWVGNDDHSPMKGVVGGSLPATIWKRFMEGAAQTVAGTAAPPSQAVAGQPNSTPTMRDQTVAAKPSPTASAEQKPRALYDQSLGAETGLAQSTPCNVAVCERYYQSFRASDCTYQPYWGPRQLCQR